MVTFMVRAGITTKHSGPRKRPFFFQNATFSPHGNIAARRSNRCRVRIRA